MRQNKSKQVMLRLSPNVLEVYKKVAVRAGVPTATIIKMCLSEQGTIEALEKILETTKKIGDIQK